MKILNCYSGIGGNRKLWKDVDVTAIELNNNIAKIYQDFFPNDKVIVADAHQYLLEHYKEFDFIWSSPPCQTHSSFRYNICVKFRGTKRTPLVTCQHPENNDRHTPTPICSDIEVDIIC